MSEASLPVVESQTDTPPLSAGALLRQAREAAGLHVAALAVSMKVPVKKLEALEADRLDLLPDAVFVRALASSVCRALKMDPTPVLQRLPQTVVPRLDAERRGINEPFQVSNQSAQVSLLSLVTKPASLGVIGLLVAAGAVAVLPRIPGLEKDLEPLSPQTAPAGSVADVVPTEVINNPAPLVASIEQIAVPPVTAASSPVTAATKPVSVDVSTAPAATTDKPGASAPAALVMPTLRPASAPAVAAVVKPVSASGPASISAPIDLAHATNGIAVFKASGTSWVEVTDAKGVVQLRKTLAAGETVAASGALPLAVVIGRSDVTQVDVRGKPFSLVGIAKDNVARFEVK